MREDQKPRSIDVKIPVNKRSLELNAVFHIVIRQIRKHLFSKGLGFVEYENEYTGKVRLPLDDEMVKSLIKETLGTKVEVMGTSFATATRNYEHDEMKRVLKLIETWAATDLKFDIVYKKKLEAIEEKYKEPEDG